MHEIEGKVLNSEIGKLGKPLRMVKFFKILMVVFFLLMLGSCAMAVICLIWGQPLQAVLFTLGFFICIFMWVKSARWHRKALYSLALVTGSVLNNLKDPFYNPEL